ncbi:MAG: tetratricopeptide repeat protein [Planctomycetota bacterium]
MSRAPLEEGDLARRLVDEGIVAKADLDAALPDRPEGQPLGVFLVMRGLVSPDQLERLLFPADGPSTAARRGDVLVAAALLEGRVVGHDQVEEARRVQRDVPLPLGTLLVRMGSVSPTELRRGAPPGMEEPIPGEPVAWSPEVLEALRDPKRRFGKYVLVEEVGRGGMGVVYRAYDALLDRQVALKMLLADAFMVGAATTAGSMTTETQVERFKREARAAGKLSHPGIIPIYEVGVQNGFHFFTMEFVEGPSLEKLLRGARLAPKLAARLAQEAAEALHHSHQAGVIHRDIKPGNLLLSIATAAVPTESTVATRLVLQAPVLSELSGRIRIADFGLARNVAAQGLTTRGEVMGTPAYMAPEQASGEIRRVGPRSDVYSLGAVLYHAVTGRPPFLGEGPMQVIAQVLGTDPEPPRSRVPDLPFDLEVIILRAMSKEPERRYADAQALADDLGRFQRGEAIHARPISRIERASRWVGRHRALSASLLALAIALPVGTWLGVTTVLDRRALDRALVLESRGSVLLREAQDAQRNPNPDWKAILRKFALARDAFDAALSEYPTLSTSLHGRAISALGLGRTDEALSFLDRLVETKPDFAQGWYDRAQVRLYMLAIRTDPMRRASRPDRKWTRGHTAFQVTPEDRAMVDQVRDDLGRVASIEPDRVKSQGAPMMLLLIDGKPKEALDAVNELIDADPNLPWSWLLRARCLAGLGRPGQALEEADRFLAVLPNHEDGGLVRAFILLDLDRPDQAAIALRRLFSRVLDDEATVRSVTDILLTHGFGDVALEEYKRGATDPLAAWRLAGMAYAHLVRRDYAATLSCIDDAIRLEPENGPFRSLRGHALQGLGRWEESIPEFQSAGRLRGLSDAQMRYWIANAEFQAGRTDRALEELGRLIAEGEEWSEPWLLRGMIRWRQGDPAAAEADLAKAIKLDPFDARTIGLYGGVLCALGRFEEALARYEEEIRLLPKDADARTNLGTCLDSLSRPEEALEAYDVAVGLDPDNLGASLLRANLLYRMGRNAEAEKECTRGLSRHADDGGLLFTRAKARYQDSKLEEALGDLAAYLVKDPGRKEAVRLRGECYYYMDRWEEARRDLEATIAPDEKDATAWLMLGVCAAQQGDRAAIEFLRKAESLYPPGPERDRARGAREAAEKKLGR